jgi:hypothetical protein
VVKVPKPSPQPTQVDQKTLSFLDELASYTKRGLSDQGIYLTSVGSEFIKKVIIKPLPSYKRTSRAKTQASNIDLNADPDTKQLNDSCSSSDEKIGLFL